MTDRKSVPKLAIGFVLTPGMLTSGTALPYEMWLAAGDFQRARRRPPAFDLHLVSTAVGESCGRLPLAADCGLTDSPPFDVIYLPALWRRPQSVHRRTPALSDWLRERHARGTLIAAVSTGVSLLAASGLLDGRAATTHWFDFERFARAHPAVDLKRDYFITQSGACYCAASINSIADVTVHLVERFVDRACAHHVERNFSHEIRRTYAEYRYLDGGSAPSPDEVVVEAQMWIEDNLGARMVIADLAARTGVGVRTLERRFRNALGVSPRRYWQSRRMQLAKELLETTNLSVGEIAWRVGYGDAGYFTRLFQREMLLTPSEYRQTLRAKLFRAPSSAAVKDFDSGRKPTKRKQNNRV